MWPENKKVSTCASSPLHLFLSKLDVHLLGQKFKRSEGNKSPSIEPEIALFGDCTSMNLGPDECVQVYAFYGMYCVS
jgi:hypothetical protein